MPQIAVKVSESIFAKLKRLAHQGRTTYADIIERALSDYEPDTSEHASHGASEIHGDLQALIESALQPVLERLAMLESMGIVKHPHPASITVEIAQNAPEIAVESAIKVLPGAMENEAVPIPPSILSNTHQGDEPRAFAELPESDKQHWRGVMLDWQRADLSNPAISKRLWDEQRIGQHSFGKLAPLDRNRTKTEIDRAKGVK